MKYLRSFNESKNVGKLYHFVDERQLRFILRNKGILFGTNDLRKYDPDIDKDTLEEDYKKAGSISTTRRKNLNWGDIRITLDGDSISNNYKIKPVHYWNKETKERNSDIDFKRKGGEWQKDKIEFRKYGDIYNGSMPINQYEERIIGEEFDFLSIKYIICIDIDNTLPIELYNEIKEEFNKYDIEVNYIKYK